MARIFIMLVALTCVAWFVPSLQGQAQAPGNQYGRYYYNGFTGAGATPGTSYNPLTGTSYYRGGVAFNPWTGRYPQGTNNYNFCTNTYSGGFNYYNPFTNTYGYYPNSPINP
jgi:hypothetical protein